MFKHFFDAKSVAVIGASRTPGKVGYDVVKNLMDCQYDGRVHPVNPKAEEILGLRCYPSVVDVDGEVELAVIVIPARFVLDTIDQCARKGVKAVIVITAGFKEAGKEGADLERQLAEKCRQEGIRCIGPNCLGIMSLPNKLNASFGGSLPKPGRIAFFSQSGALGTAILDVCVGEDIGISRFISYGNKADVDETDLIEALGDDDETDVILGYIESINDGQKFMEVASRVTRKKPVVVFKSGRTSAGARAASSHTGSLAGADSAYEAAFKQCGVIRARNIAEFFDFARAFATRRMPAGPNVAIVTNAGGPGIIATDAIESSKLDMATLAPTTEQALAASMPPQANIHNPIDVLGDARADRYKTAMDIAVADDDVATILAILTPQTSTEPEMTAIAIADVAAATDKPVVASFMGSASMRGAWKMLEERGVPNFDQPDRAVKALEALLTLSEWQQAEPAKPPRFDFDADAIRGVIAEAKGKGHETLSEREARLIADACGIPLPGSAFAATEDDAARAAAEFGGPVVMKISSDDILHKSDAGGVKVGIEGEDAVRAGYRAIMESARAYDADARLDGVLVQQMAPEGREVIVGVNADPQFGPVIMFGLGGIYVEVLKDVVFRVAPLTAGDADSMIHGIRSAKLLGAFRGEPAGDLQAMAEVLLRVSQLAVDFPELIECDLNPVRIYPEGQGVMALDVRFGLA